MVDGKILLSAGSTVPTVEAAHVVLPIKEVKVEPQTDIDMPEVKVEPDIEPKPIIKPKKQSTFPLPGSLFVGDLRLANLKNRLGSLQPPIPAEFAGEGILICGPGIHQGAQAKGGSMVAVRKLAQGQIVLEGGVGRTYDVVRKELYKGFARVVAA